MFSTTSLLRGAFLVSAATLPLTFAAPEAKALCVGSNSTCTTFSSTTLSQPSLPAGTFSGTGATGATYNRIGVRFEFNTPSGIPTSFTLNNVKIGGGLTAGIAPASFYNLGNLTITSQGTPQAFPGGSNTSFFLQTTNLLSATSGSAVTSISASNLAAAFAASTLSFDIPAGLPEGSSLSASIIYGSPANVIRASSTFDTLAVPGPLGVLGLAAAVSQSRRIKRRLAASLA